MRHNGLAAYYHTLPLSICVLDNQRNIVFVNKKFKELLKGRGKNLTGKSVTNIFPIFKENYFKQRLEQVYDQNTPLYISSGLHGTIIANCFSKEATYFEVSVSPIEHDGIQTDHVVLTIEDVTDMMMQIRQQRELLKTLNEQLEQSKIAQQKMEEVQAELQKANDAKDKLFSIIGHDLRTPFNALSGISELLMKSNKLSGETELKRMYEAIWLASNQGSELVTNLLNWAQSQSNSIKPFPVHFNIVTLIRELESFFALNLKKKSIKLTFKCHISHHKVFADMDMIKVVLQNLLSNAIKFTPNDYGIEIQLLPHGSHRMLIMVQDHGIGMPQDLIDRILAQESVSSGIGTEMETGTGIGLTICHEFLHINKSRLHITSELGKGSRFYFTLPQFNKSPKSLNTIEENQSLPGYF